MNALRPRFRVGFSDLIGGTDRTPIVVNLTRFTGFAGAVVTLTSHCDASAQAFSSFSDVATVRAFVGCSLLR